MLVNNYQRNAIVVLVGKHTLIKLRDFKHQVFSFIGHPLFCSSSCHRSLCTHRQCGLPSEGRCRRQLLQTLKIEVLSKKNTYAKQNISYIEQQQSQILCFSLYPFPNFQTTHFCMDQCTVHPRKRGGNRKDLVEKYLPPSLDKDLLTSATTNLSLQPHVANHCEKKCSKDSVPPRVEQRPLCIVDLMTGALHHRFKCKKVHWDSPLSVRLYFSSSRPVLAHCQQYQVPHNHQGSLVTCQ